jgi:glycosyltransferase involved in cell wall biosynthesis
MNVNPLVTLVLFSYNQEDYILEALEGALAQTYSPLEIIISDDFSSDNTFNIISNVMAKYRGPHRIIYRQNQTNLGLAEHINKVMPIVSGKLVITAAGDDISYPNRVFVLVKKWNEIGQSSGSIFSRFNTINSNGFIDTVLPQQNDFTVKLAERRLDILEALTSGTYGCANAWTKDIFDIFGDIDKNIIHEDVAISLRSFLVGSITFISEPLVLYRLTIGSQSRIDFTSYYDRLRKMEKYWCGKVANYKQFSIDTQAAFMLRHINEEDTLWLESNTIFKKEHASLSFRFFSSSYKGRLIVLINSFSRVSYNQWMKWLVIALIPWVYGFNFKKKL